MISLADLNLKCVKEIVDYLYLHAQNTNIMYFVDDFPFFDDYSHEDMNFAIKSLVKNGYVLFDKIDGNNTTRYKVGKLTSIGQEAHQQFSNSHF